MKIGNVSVYVNDLDRAIAFYRDVLGWEMRVDATMPDGSRWVAVAPPRAETGFTLVHRYSDWTPEMVGGWSGIVVEVEDVFKTYDELKERGVEFDETPRREPWGGWAAFSDSEGNRFGLHDHHAAGSPPEKTFMARFLGA